MSQEYEARLRAAAESMTAKFQAFYRGLSADEQLVLAAMLKKSGLAEVKGDRLMWRVTVDLPNAE